MARNVLITSVGCHTLPEMARNLEMLGAGLFKTAKRLWVANTLRASYILEWMKVGNNTYTWERFYATSAKIRLIKEALALPQHYQDRTLASP